MIDFVRIMLHSSIVKDSELLILLRGVLCTIPPNDKNLMFRNRRVVMMIYLGFYLSRSKSCSKDNIVRNQY